MAPYPLANLPRGVLTLAQNENPMPPSPAAVEAGRAAVTSANIYPDPDWQAMRAAIAEVHGLDAESILCGAGSMEIIDCVVRAYAGPGDTVLGTQYGYLFLSTACQRAGARHEMAPERDYKVSVDALLEAAGPDTRIVFVCNPGNPTGTALDADEMTRLREGLPACTMLVVDQAYTEYAGPEHDSLLALAERGDSVVTRTFSKAYGMAGMRVGWGVLSADAAQHVRKLLNPNNLSSVSQAMAEAAIRDQEHMRRAVAETVAARDRFVSRLEAAGYVPPKSSTNFVLVPFADSAAAKSVESTMREEGMHPRNMTGYGLDHCLRITVGLAYTMERTAEILEEHAESGA